MIRDFETKYTAGQMKLEKIVNDLGFQTVLEYEVGSYSLDLFIPEMHVGIEFDGPFHWKKRDAKRDAIIFEMEGISILRISDIKDKALKSKIETFILSGGKSIA